MLNAVNEAENKLESLKEQNALAREKLKGTEYEENSYSRKIYVEIDEIEQKLSDCYKEYAIAKENLQKLIRTYDTILN